MYKVLIADDDILMKQALNIMISREEKFEVKKMVGTGEEAVKACKEEDVDIVFIDFRMPGITGLEASRIIYQSNSKIDIYLLLDYSTNIIISNEVKDSVKDIFEKPITYAKLKRALDSYESKHEDSVQKQLEQLTEILKNRDFEFFYMNLNKIIDEIYAIGNEDSIKLIEIFKYIGRNLLDTINFYDDQKNITEIFPINEGLILEKKTSELWLFQIMDYLFQQNSINRYPLLENIFIYIDNHIKEDITLNKIIDNCAISQGYLSRIFREQFQVSVTEYLHMKKMNLAKGYFYFTSDSIAEVAFRLGYNESSYFSKVFKKYEKMTVKQYKNGILMK